MYIKCTTNQGDGIKGALVVGLQNFDFRTTGTEGSMTNLIWVRYTPSLV